MWQILIHGGATPIDGLNTEADSAALSVAVQIGCHMLKDGASALDAVEATIRSLEDSALFIAGKGACPNELGRWELDACICDGATRRIGSVAGLEGYYPPISIARSVMEKTVNALFVGSGAARIAEKYAFQEIRNPGSFFKPASARRGSVDEVVHGTVGAIALDQSGRLAAGTSTGGAIGKRAGRVGDSPIAGAGTWADKNAAISCTGQGEYFIRTAAAHCVATRMQFLDEPLGDSMKAVISEIHGLGGEGGMIVLDARGRAGYAFNSEALRFGVADSRGNFKAGVIFRSRDLDAEVRELA